VAELDQEKGTGCHQRERHQEKVPRDACVPAFWTVDVDRANVPPLSRFQSFQAYAKAQGRNAKSTRGVGMDVDARIDELIRRQESINNVQLHISLPEKCLTATATARRLARNDDFGE